MEMEALEGSPKAPVLIIGGSAGEEDRECSVTFMDQAQGSTDVPARLGFDPQLLGFRPRDPVFGNDVANHVAWSDLIEDGNV